MSNMKKWTMVVNEFVQICQRYKIPTPQFEYSKDEEYTDSNSDIDFTANGFKIRANAGGYNESGAKNLYIAFADQPFNLAKAR